MKRLNIPPSATTITALLHSCIASGASPQSLTKVMDVVESVDDHVMDSDVKTLLGTLSNQIPEFRDRISAFVKCKLKLIRSTGSYFPVALI